MHLRGFYNGVQCGHPHANHGPTPLSFSAFYWNKCCCKHMCSSISVWLRKTERFSVAFRNLRPVFFNHCFSSPAVIQIMMRIRGTGREMEDWPATRRAGQTPSSARSTCSSTIAAIGPTISNPARLLRVQPRRNLRPKEPQSPPPSCAKK